MYCKVCQTLSTFCVWLCHVHLLYDPPGRRRGASG